MGIEFIGLGRLYEMVRDSFGERPYLALLALTYAAFIVGLLYVIGRFGFVPLFSSARSWFGEDGISFSFGSILPVILASIVSLLVISVGVWLTSRGMATLALRLESYGDRTRRFEEKETQLLQAVGDHASITSELQGVLSGLQGVFEGHIKRWSRLSEQRCPV